MISVEGAKPSGDKSPRHRELCVGCLGAGIEYECFALKREQAPSPQKAVLCKVSGGDPAF